MPIIFYTLCLINIHCVLANNEYSLDLKSNDSAIVPEKENQRDGKRK